MPLGQNKILTILLMLLVFTSQAMASIVMPCPMTMQATTMNMDKMNHAQHNMTQSTTPAERAETEAMDCHDQSCNCPTGHCASMALPIASNMTKAMISSAKIDQLPQLIVNQTPLSLYRPPIIG